MKNKTKVAVGMSGGVDSTVAAWLLREHGYDVTGLTMRLWNGEEAEIDLRRNGCYGPGGIYNACLAQQTCERLGIPHHTIDLSREFKSRVLDNFAKEYLGGRTPNPCVLCNPLIKFGALLEKAADFGIDFDFFATGHYARVEFEKKNDRILLKKAVDLKKDQSYFLYQLTQTQLERIIFPLGIYKKEQVRILAQKAGFSDIADKPESQDFINENINNLIFSAAENHPGEIIDLKGNVLGNHPGIVYFTVGQRKGIKIGGMKKPLYVLNINPTNNQIIVGPKESLAVDQLTAGLTNWIAFKNLDKSIEAYARLRSTQKEVPCVISPKEGRTIEVTFILPQSPATPGQSIVFYSDDIVLGGGIIQTTHHFE